MRYLSPEEIREHKDILKKACIEEADSGMIGDGTATGRIKKYVPPEARVLDLGAGSGLFLSKLHNAGYQNIYGADIDDYRSYADGSSGMVKEFAALDAGNDSFPWADGFFDAVTAWEVFEHLENPYRSIREVARIIKTGGYLFVSMPNVLSLTHRIFFAKNGELVRWSEENNHIAVFTPALFKKAFRNFEPVENGYYKGQFQYRFLAHIPMPANKWFGESAWWVLRKK